MSGWVAEAAATVTVARPERHCVAATIAAEVAAAAANNNVRIGVVRRGIALFVAAIAASTEEVQ